MRLVFKPLLTLTSPRRFNICLKPPFNMSSTLTFELSRNRNWGDGAGVALCWDGCEDGELFLSFHYFIPYSPSISNYSFFFDILILTIILTHSYPVLDLPAFSSSFIHSHPFLYLSSSYLLTPSPILIHLPDRRKT